MHSKISKKVIDKNLQEVALRMTLHCVRNTIIEDFHAQGKLSNENMKFFNKEVANKIYSYLQILLNPYYEKERKLLFTDHTLRIAFHLPLDWDTPKFDKDFLHVLKLAKSKRR